MSAHLRRTRGFSLVELMVALVISMVVIAGALALLTSQQRSFRSSSSDRALQETARIALDHIATNLRLAGYGIDPSFAFDFGEQEVVPMARAVPGTAVSKPAWRCANPVACRDRTDGPDELVFLARDPGFGVTLAQPAAADELVIAGPLRTPLRAGQILQVMCYGGEMYWAYVTVGANVDATDEAVEVRVPLAPGAAAAFPLQNAALADPCFSAVAPPGADANTIAGATKVFKVDRFRYFVRNYTEAGEVADWGAPGSRPYLMLDQGLSGPNGAPIEMVVAPDVEDLQVAYVFPRSADALQLVGATVGAQITADGDGIDLAPGVGAPSYGDGPEAPPRLTQHPGNILAARVSVVVRSANPDAELLTADARTIPAAGNRAEIADAPAGFRRILLETTVPTRNTDTRAPYYPTYSTLAGDQLNAGGG